MSTEAPPAPAPNTPAAPNLNPNPGSTPHSTDKPTISLAEAAKAHEHYEKTGERTDLKKATPPPKAPAQKEAQPPATKKEEPAKKEGETKPGPLSGLKAKPEAKAKETPPPTTKPADAPEDTSQARWTALKDAEKRLSQIEPEHLETKKERDALKAEKESWAAERKELEDLRKIRDFTDVRQGPRWKKEVETPFNTIQGFASEVAEYAEIPLHDLMDAMREPNSMKREDSIRAILENAKKEIKAANISKLVQQGDELAKIETIAQEIRNNASLEKEQYENQQKAEKLRVETETRQLQAKAQREMIDTLKVKAHDVISEDMLNNAVELGKNPNTDPMDVAYRDMAPYLLNQLIESVREERLAKDQEIEQLKADLEAATSAKPGIHPDKDKINPGNTSTYKTLQEATAAHKEGNYHM